MLYKFIFSRVPYIEAIILECERFHEVVPISGPRRVLKDTTLEGFSIPKVKWSEELILKLAFYLIIFLGNHCSD